MIWFLLAIGIIVVFLALQDLLQDKHTIRRNFPIIGRFRYIFEHFGPPLRQYIFQNNNEERPFPRNERRWIYSSAKKQNDMFGFGTDSNVEDPNHVIIKQAAFPITAPDVGDPAGPPDWILPCAKVIGQSHNRPKAFRPSSLVYISGMSYGALSSAAIEALNKGAKIAGCLQNTGEGGISKYHDYGGDLIFQIGTGYFGARDEDGNFSLPELKKTIERHPTVKAIEIKFSQGAKPGLGGVLPAAKVTKDIAEARGITAGVTCKSPNHHKAFHDVDSMIDFIEFLALETGLPVGIKSAVGELDFWADLANKMQQRPNEGPDFITIDGSEGGTGAAPLVYTDHVSLPFMVGFPRVYTLFASKGLHHDIVWIGAGRLGVPGRALTAMAMGCDMLAVAREPMLAIGCIQAQSCHTNRCPTGVATHNRWLVAGLNPTDKSARCANYLLALRRELLSLARTCGVDHPALVGPERLEMMREHLQSITVRQAMGYEEGWALPSEDQQQELVKLMKP